LKTSIKSGNQQERHVRLGISARPLAIGTCEVWHSGEKKKVFIIILPNTCDNTSELKPQMI